MLNSFKARIHILLPLIFAASAVLNAETFRIAELGVLNIQEDTEYEQSVKIGLSDAAVFFLPAEQTFIEGLEIKMDIPESAAMWRNSIACSIYDRITPTPSPDQIDYSGSCFYHGLVPGKLSWIIEIPFSKETKIKSNQYTTKVEEIPDLSKNFIYLRLYPAMKGMTDEILDSIITVTVKPILKDKGQMNFSLKPSEGELLPCSVFIDDTAYEYKSENQLLLDTGVHNISVISEYYRTEVRTVRIDQAKQTKLAIELKSIEPTLLLTAPAGTKIFFDDEECTSIGKEFIISEGEHKLVFSIGDYEIARTINATKGKTYKINFLMDLQISEE